MAWLKLSKKSLSNQFFRSMLPKSLYQNVHFKHLYKYNAYCTVFQRLLAEQGTTYTNAFATTPICCPSRWCICKLRIGCYLQAYFWLDILLLSIKVMYLLTPYWCSSTGILLIGYYVAVHQGDVFADSLLGLIYRHTYFWLDIMLLSIKMMHLLTPYWG